jgi:hypothetical protein
MRGIHSIRSAVGVGALILAGLAMTSGSARAQQACYIHDPLLGLIIAYSECQEAAGGASAVGSNLTAIGEGFVQQQLNIGAGIAGFTSPTGRLRHTEHDGLTEKSTGARTDGFEIDEGSVFANVSYDLPGTYFGGRVRVNALAGYNSLSQELDTPGNSTDIDAFIYGGSYLWSQGSFYSMSLLIGVSGEADAITTGAAAAGGAGGGRYDYDLSGYFSNSVMGYTFDWPGNGWRFDLRAGLGHYDISTNTFQFAANNNTIKGVSEAWSGSITGTLFTIVEVGGGTFRPYILGSY